MLALNANSIVIGALAVIGARRYNICLVGFALFWLVLDFTLTVWALIKVERTDSDAEEYDPALYNDDGEFHTTSIESILVYIVIAVHAIITALYSYPHAVFIYEVNSGKQRSIHCRN